MPKQKQELLVKRWAGLRSPSQEPQILIWVIGPVAVHIKSSARIFGTVARTSRPLVVMSGGWSHFCGTTAVVKGDGGQLVAGALVAALVEENGASEGGRPGPTG